MAEGGSEERCGYLLGGVCRNGRRCPLAHCHPTRPGNDVCHFYLSGHCIYGSQCWYDHGPRSGASGLTWGRSDRSQNGSAEGRSSDITRPTTSRSPFAGPFTARGTDHTRPSWRGVRSRATSWADAPEFYPRGWAASTGSAESHDEAPPSKRASLPPPPFEVLVENTGAGCSYVPEQRRQHREQCAEQEVREPPSAAQASAGKACAICMEIVVEKEPVSERRFGLMEKCNHVFCLSCIRRWRTCKEFDNDVIRSCPLCRKPSSFVTPSSSWMDAGKEKDALMAAYKTAMSQKPCRYFKEGRGHCPFAGSCFYKHAYPDGSPAAISPPRTRRMHSTDLGHAESRYLWDILDVVDSPEFAPFYFRSEAEPSNTTAERASNDDDDDS